VREYYEDETVIELKKKMINKSIQEFLHLFERFWFVEFELSDFGASLCALFELPSSIYHSQVKAFFWAFIDQFLQRSAIGFILNNKLSGDLNQEPKIDLAFIGYWENQEFAIPLWIMSDILVGFEILSEDQYSVLDAFPLSWQSPFLPKWKINTPKENNAEIYVLNGEVFQDETLYLKITGGNVFISDFNWIDELKFFERIASTIIPEIDDIDFEE